MAVSLQQLIEIEKLRSLKSTQRLQAIEAEVAGLKKKIDTLKGHRRDSHSTDTELIPMRSIGSDVLWNAWLDRTQMDLTLELAQVMARKEQVSALVRQDLGRKNAAENVVSEAETKKRAFETKKRLEGLLQDGVTQKLLR